jgi:hypothetical protein
VSFAGHRLATSWAYLCTVAVVGPCRPSTIRSARDCHPCLRYVLSAMSPGRTNTIMVAAAVAIEPVSASKFPAIREIIREFLRFQKLQSYFWLKTTNNHSLLRAYLHSCSGCFRLERSPGGICTHWKAPPCHGAHPSRTYRRCAFPEAYRLFRFLLRGTGIVLATRQPHRRKRCH